jgi:hypothetical protein
MVEVEWNRVNYYWGQCWHIVQVPDDDGWVRSKRYNASQGKPKYSEKTCLSAALSITNPTRPDLDSKPDRLSEKPTTHRLRYGTAIIAVSEDTAYENSNLETSRKENVETTQRTEKPA